MEVLGIHTSPLEKKMLKFNFNDTLISSIDHNNDGITTLCDIDDDDKEEEEDDDDGDYLLKYKLENVLSEKLIEIKNEDDEEGEDSISNIINKYSLKLSKNKENVDDVKLESLSSFSLLQRLETTTPSSLSSQPSSSHRHLGCTDEKITPPPSSSLSSLLSSEVDGGLLKFDHLDLRRITLSSFETNTPQLPSRTLSQFKKSSLASVVGQSFTENVDGDFIDDNVTTATAATTATTTAAASSHGSHVAKLIEDYKHGLINESINVNRKSSGDDISIGNTNKTSLASSLLGSRQNISSNHDQLKQHNNFDSMPSKDNSVPIHNQFNNANKSNNTNSRLSPSKMSTTQQKQQFDINPSTETSLNINSNILLNINNNNNDDNIIIINNGDVIINSHDHLTQPPPSSSADILTDIMKGLNMQAVDNNIFLEEFNNTLPVDFNDSFNNSFNNNNDNNDNNNNNRNDDDNILANFRRFSRKFQIDSSSDNIFDTSSTNIDAIGAPSHSTASLPSSLIASSSALFKSEEKSDNDGDEDDECSLINLDDFDDFNLLSTAPPASNSNNDSLL
ncbi:hypothetical protein HELRODRAFT_179621 [Helobdella robusta]|uniref:Uncharacterized protein n=1 Tax=Helobdella robusta TaxID=6412 RepID=T1FEY2_HELRO|nr:hypothetical protein HELRODRAFT_179621 [Helobdella robusta]ESN95277.1 hypothetical protein HELRODRAFT_179621 [Helobdella robusta]